MKKRATLILSIVLVIIASVIIIYIVQHSSEQASEQEQEVEEFKEKVLEENKEMFKRRDIKKKFEPKSIKGIENENFTVSLESKSSPTAYEYTIQNVSDKPQTLEFTTSQRYEAIINDEKGKEVYRYSDGKSFMQVLKDVTINPGDELTYEFKLPELEAGKYTLTLRLVARNALFSKKTINITVEK
ncbi:BsuPI-related putative proteinase inhibitor [Ornithinibacillus halophilus]|uniref:Intracellular proteinase inhibitor n=1 Tax=Ornithinibacillus halophilus TaxID=930117 RepID=A0A1M5EAI9_9BACI|nr:BsuPI-related putative proteinase inhibitor [Ornithinibacillus halophilus]SHF76283.1 Intracellular proteinase inhibitor [Ornithinibacillus halophilus]